MLPTDPRSQAALEAAIQKIRTTLQSVLDRVCDSLGAAAQSSARISERDVCNAALVGLRRQAGAFHRTFGQVLQEKVTEELAPRHDSGRTLAAANWQTLSLVGDDEMEERMFADRIGQTVSHACDAELRELAPYVGALLLGGRSDRERNPLRAEMLGAPLHRAIEVVSPEPAERALLAREFGQAMARAMPACYTDIVQELQARGVRPAVLSARSVEGHGSGGNSGYATLHSTRGESVDTDSPSGGAFPGSSEVRSGNSHGLGSSNRSGSGVRSGGEPGHDNVGAVADAQLMSLLRRLSAAVGQTGDHPSGLGEAGRSTARAPLTAGGRLQSVGQPASGRSFDDTAPGPGHFTRPAGLGPYDTGHERHLGPADGLMAVNLIRAHREELLQASTGQLDHMVIDVVGSLFDQILSDARVPPQMARQIARLQLPVLRVALTDRSFFSSRRHPVRRFVNRMASLACAFDDFDDGPGRHFLDRVSELVQEIVDGDFDQIELYAAQLGELERYIAEQAADEVERNGTAMTLENKETELRLQQRYMLQLQAALGPLALPGYLGDFLTQVWSQALVLAASREGPGSDRSQRFRRAGRDLVMSVQPKGSPAMRKKFLMQLPPLMKDLNDGLRLVGWPEEAQRRFFAELLPAHAESLKASPMSELDHNLMVKQLEAIFNVPMPNAGGTGSAFDDEPSPAASGPALEQRFTPEEAVRVGLVDENAVDWSGSVDIDLGAYPQAPPTAPGALLGAAPTAGDAGLPDGVDLPLDLVLGAMADAAAAGSATPEAAEPTRGLELMEHVKLGFAYQMHLKDSWQKVRLTHVSPGRNFFVFSSGRRHQETISMTSRMLARMCETGRLRAVESAYLMERATLRARRQLAAMGATAGRA